MLAPEPGLRSLGGQELALHAVDLLLEERRRFAGELGAQSQAAPDVLRRMRARHLL